MEILDGKALADSIKQELVAVTNEFTAKGWRKPHLVTVLVGENPASKVYVNNKLNACKQVGFDASLIQQPADISENALLEIVKDLNERADVDGFIVQLPLPRHINEEKITLAIAPQKDVDGFHPENFGRMAQGLPSYWPATPFGIVEMLKRYNIKTDGKHVVVVGRSNIVGTPIGVLLSRKSDPGNATVTICHSRTPDLSVFTKEADILIAAIGSADFIKGDMVKDGVVVIDVGMNRVDDPATKKGYRLTGDVDFEQVSKKASYITPVPGGVGQLTVMALLMNTIKAYRKEVYKNEL